MFSGFAVPTISAGSLPPRDLMFLSVLVLAALLGALCLRLNAKLETLRRENLDLMRTLSSKKASSTAAQAPVSAPVQDFSGGFEADLQQARMKSRLKGNEDVGEVPDKYRLLASLANRGVSGDDLDEALKILKISPAEADQLIKLSRLAQGGEARKD